MLGSPLAQVGRCFKLPGYYLLNRNCACYWHRGKFDYIATLHARFACAGNTESNEGDDDTKVHFVEVCLADGQCDVPNACAAIITSSTSFSVLSAQNVIPTTSRVLDRQHQARYITWKREAFTCVTKRISVMSFCLNTHSNLSTTPSPTTHPNPKLSSTSTSAVLASILSRQFHDRGLSFRNRVNTPSAS